MWSIGHQGPAIREGQCQVLSQLGPGHQCRGRLPRHVHALFGFHTSSLAWSCSLWIKEVIPTGGPFWGSVSRYGSRDYLPGLKPKLCYSPAGQPRAGDFTLVGPSLPSCKTGKPNGNRLRGFLGESEKRTPLENQAEPREVAGSVGPNRKTLALSCASSQHFAQDRCDQNTLCQVSVRPVLVTLVPVLQLVGFILR